MQRRRIRVMQRMCEGACRERGVCEPCYALLDLCIDSCMGGAWEKAKIEEIDDVVSEPVCRTGLQWVGWHKTRCMGAEKWGYKML